MLCKYNIMNDAVAVSYIKYAYNATASLNKFTCVNVLHEIEISGSKLMIL